MWLYVVHECSIKGSLSPSQRMTHRGSLTPTWRLLPNSTRHRSQWDQMLWTYYNNLCLMRSTSISSVTSQPRTSVKQWGFARSSPHTCDNTRWNVYTLCLFLYAVAYTQFSGSVYNNHCLIGYRHGMTWLWMVNYGMTCTGSSGLLASVWKPN